MLAAVAEEGIALQQLACVKVSVAGLPVLRCDTGELSCRSLEVHLGLMIQYSIA